MTTVRETLEICAAIIASLGGGGAIVFGLSSFLGKVWAERGLEKQRHEYTKLNLEFTHQLDLASRRLQMQLDALSVLHKLRTESEFEKVQELWRRMTALRLVVSNGSDGLKFPDEEKKRAYWTKRITEFQDRYQALSEFLERETLSIPKPIADMASKLRAVAGNQTLFFMFYPNAPQQPDDPETAGKKDFWEKYITTVESFTEGVVELEAAMRQYMAAKQDGSDESQRS